jgi:hypothetical protein
MKRLLIISAALLVGVLTSVPVAHANWPAHEPHVDYLGFCQSDAQGPSFEVR